MDVREQLCIVTETESYSSGGGSLSMAQWHYYFGCHWAFPSDKHATGGKVCGYDLNGLWSMQGKLSRAQPV